MMKERKKAQPNNRVLENRREGHRAMIMSRKDIRNMVRRTYIMRRT